MAKQYKLDLFNFLNNISQKNEKFYKTLSDEEIKEISPLIMMRWLSGTKDARQIFFLNELVNPFVFNLSKHKELLIDLMTLCTTGRSQRYQFNKIKNKRTTRMPKVTVTIKEYFGYNTADALNVIPILSNEDILSFAEDLGKQKPEITIIKRELKTRRT